MWCQCSTDVEIHTYLLHCERLNSLCRICGERSKRCDLKPVKLCRNYVSELARYYDLHISAETNGTLYSSTFCSKCYVRLVKLNNSTHSSEGVLKSAKDQIEYANRVWTRVDSTAEVANCSVHCKFARQLKGDRPFKPGRGPKRPHVQGQSVCNCGSEVADSSISSHSFQPQTYSTSNVRKRLIDYLSSPTVVNQSNANDNICVPDSDTCPLLNTSTLMQQTFQTHYAKVNNIMLF